MKGTRKQKPYWEMTARQLAEATKEYDHEIPDSMLQPLTREERALWEKSRRQPSRSIYILSGGRKKTEAVLVELDGKLLRKMDVCARERGLTRTQYIERGIRKALIEDVQIARPARKSA